MIPCKSVVSGGFQRCNPFRVSSCVFCCKLCPLCFSFFMFLAIMILNWVMFDFFIDFSFESVMDLYSTRIENEVNSFFENKLEFFNQLQFDFESGNYDNAKNYEEYEKFFFSRFREDEDIHAFYTIFSNDNTFKLHRETPGYLSTQIRVFVNESYQYRWDRQRPISTARNMSNFKVTDPLVADYIPKNKDWYKDGLKYYPSGFWEGPSFSSSSCSSVGCSSPIYIYVRKVEWANSSLHSVHKVKFRTSSIDALLRSLYEREEMDVMDFVVVNQKFEVVSYRSVEDQVYTVGTKKKFKKIWELDVEHFEALDEESLIAALSGDEEISGYRIVSLGSGTSNEDTWALVFHVSQSGYFASLYARRVISIVLSFLVLILFGAIVAITSCSMCEMRCSEDRKRNALKTVRRISESISKLDFENKKVKRLMKKKRRRCTKLEKYMQEIIINIRSYMEFLPAQFLISEKEKAIAHSPELPEDHSSSDSSVGTNVVSTHENEDDQHSSDDSEKSGPKTFDSTTSSCTRPTSQEGSSSAGTASTFGIWSSSKKKKKRGFGRKTKGRFVNIGMGLEYYQAEGTAMMINLTHSCPNFKTMFKTTHPEQVSAFFNSYFGLLSHVQSKLGVVHSLWSHEIFASWNIGRRVVEHRENALKAAVMILKQFEESVLPIISGKHFEVGITIGLVSCRRAYYGNVVGGCMKGIALCGDMIQDARDMMARNKMYETSLLCDEKIGNSVSMYMPVHIVDVVGDTERFLFTFSDQLSKNDPLRRGLKKQKEWMYVLNDKKNPFEGLNDAWKFFREGMYQKSEEIVNAFEESASPKLMVHVNRLKEKLPGEEEEEEYVHQTVNDPESVGSGKGNQESVEEGSHANVEVVNNPLKDNILAAD